MMKFLFFALGIAAASFFRQFELFLVVITNKNSIENT